MNLLRFWISLAKLSKRYLRANEHGCVPLHKACCRNSTIVECIQRLVQADVYTVLLQQTLDGDSPVHLASRHYKHSNRESSHVILHLRRQQAKAIQQIGGAVDCLLETQLGMPDLVMQKLGALIDPTCNFHNIG
eukprot:CAMPEP_0202497808 /NCGR_PEP_ID=MMETSP1361-20130828/23951_1 /ASSEMBLY_ACC=CAM_ASM_000849 /TAXON_ID=210615 /ORGANISM="Staurosira complex sp., Strain CCMP2646" /LENGTH=133 /DNA_ID=CAMNT_0049129511 /DNA_START=656 /DNA_END=1057 /DNA_ORIENTATION=-